jgi:hypothetical protein
MGTLLAELAAFGLAVGLLPPAHRPGAAAAARPQAPAAAAAGLWPAGCSPPPAAVLLLLLSVGHGLLLTMEKGSGHRTGLDLLGAGALLALGLQGAAGGPGRPAPRRRCQPPGWATQAGALLRPAPAPAAGGECPGGAGQPRRPLPAGQNRQQPAGGKPGPRQGTARRRGVHPGEWAAAAAATAGIAAGGPRAGAAAAAQRQAVAVRQGRPAGGLGEHRPGRSTWAGRGSRGCNWGRPWPRDRR